MKLADMYRLSDVKRWQIVKTDKVQSVAEHSYHVAMISSRIAMKLHPDAKISMDLATACINWAMWHDMPEVFTGDIATPIKQVMKSDNLTAFEDKLCGEDYMLVRTTSTEINPIVGAIVKIADLLESVKFITQNARNDHGNSVIAKLRPRMSAKILEAANEWPDLNWQTVEDCIQELFGDETYLDDYL